MGDFLASVMLVCLKNEKNLTFGKCMENLTYFPNVSLFGNSFYIWDMYRKLCEMYGIILKFRQSLFGRLGNYGQKIPGTLMKKKLWETWGTRTYIGN